MDKEELRRLWLRRASYTRAYGPDDPRTVEAARAELDARITAAEAETARLRALRDALPDAVAA